jgi:hypothetical protein
MDSMGLYDIYDYWYTPIWQTGAFKVVIVFLCLVAFLGVTFLIIKKIRYMRSIDPWDIWVRSLNAMCTKKIVHKKFYETITQILKEIAVTKLNAPAGSTDSDLIDFFKNETFPVEVRILGDIIHRGTMHKFDPTCFESIVQEKELEYVIAAHTVIKKMVLQDNNKKNNNKI